MASKDFEDFRWSCFDPSFYAHHDGLNVAALRRLAGDERAEAERTILAVLPNTTDVRPIQAAGYLKLHAASEPLKQRLATDLDGKERPYNRVEAALALHRIEGYPAAIDIVIGVLCSLKQDDWTLMTVIVALGEIGPGREAVIAVIERVAQHRDGWVSGMLTDLLEQLAAADAGDATFAAIPEDKRAALLTALLRQLGTTRNSEFAVPLGLLRASAAAREIRTLLHCGRSRDRVRAAVALYRIADYSKAEDVLLEVLHGLPAPHQMDRREAALALAWLRPSQRIVDALVYTVAADEDRFVAWTAWSALRAMFRGDEAASEFLCNLDQPLTAVFAVPSEEDVRRLRSLRIVAG